jgi:hypothetical protein
MSHAAAEVRAAARRLPSLVRVHVVPPKASRACPLDRVAWLTPYEAETIGEDARRAGRGTLLEVTVPRPISEDRLEAVRTIFAWLVPKGIEVRVRAED